MDYVCEKCGVIQYQVKEKRGKIKNYFICNDCNKLSYTTYIHMDDTTNYAEKPYWDLDNNNKKDERLQRT